MITSKPGLVPCAGSVHSTLTIRYPTPIWVWMYWGESGVGSSFLRRVAMNTRREAMLLSQLCPQMFWDIEPKDLLQFA